MKSENAVDISANEAAGKPVLSNITVDLTGGGTIDGFAFAANGTLNVEGLPVRPVENVFISWSVANAANLDNIANWSLRGVDDLPVRRKMKVSTSGIMIMPLGFRINFR